MLATIAGFLMTFLLSPSIIIRGIIVGLAVKVVLRTGVLWKKENGVGKKKKLQTRGHKCSEYRVADIKLKFKILLYQQRRRSSILKSVMTYTGQLLSLLNTYLSTVVPQFKRLRYKRLLM